MSNLRIRRRLTRTAGHSSPPSVGAPVVSAVPRLLTAMAALLAATLAAYLLGNTALEAASNAAWWRPDDAVAASLASLGALVASWYALTALGLLASILGSLDLRVSTWGAPLLRTLSVGAGSVTLAFGAPAFASATDLPLSITADPAWSSDGEPLDAAWGASAVPTSNMQPSRTVTAADLLTMARAPAHGVDIRTFPEDETSEATAAQDPDPELPSNHIDGPSEVHIVNAGEYLWSIAAAEKPGASNSWIAHRVADYVDINPELAPNPDLIFPGQSLTIPAEQP